MACQSSLTLKVLRTLWGLKIITARSIKALKIPSLLAPRPSIVYNRGIEYFHSTSRGSLQGTICVHSHPDGPGSAKSCCPCRRCRPPRRVRSRDPRCYKGGGAAGLRHSELSRASAVCVGPGLRSEWVCGARGVAGSFVQCLFIYF